MLNAILIILIIIAFIGLISSSNTNDMTLNCGLWLYHGKASKPLFQWAKFDILGISSLDVIAELEIKHGKAPKPVDNSEVFKLFVRVIL